MRSLKYALTIAAFLYSPCVGAGDSNWAVYRDPNHGCRVDFPAQLFTTDQPRQGEPQNFSSRNRDTYFQILGVENSSGWSSSDIRRKYLDRRMPGIVIYQHASDNSVTLSGYRDQDSFYTKVTVSEDLRTACILDISYPLLSSKHFHAVAARMLRSFIISQSGRTKLERLE
jgi:hypothetical protein